MKLLHTGDWHLGLSLYHHDRSGEQRAMLRQLADICADERPDAMLVCGDVYDVAAPSAATVAMFVDGLLGIRRAAPDMDIIVAAGNHDSASRIEADRDLWRIAGVTVVGAVRRMADGQPDYNRHIVELRGNRGFVVAVPHCYGSNFPVPPQAAVERDARLAHFFNALLCRVADRNADRQLPVAMMAHLAVSGSSLRGHERTIGNLDTVPLADLGYGYDYLALGHIHHPQWVGGNQQARYSGSPLAVSFDEDYPHGVDIVEVEHGCPAVLRTIAVADSVTLLTVPSDPLPLAEALDALAALPDDRPCCVRLLVAAEGPLPADTFERAADALAQKAATLCDIKVVRPAAEHDRQPITAIDLHEFVSLSPADVAERFLASQGRELTDDYRRMLQQAIEHVQAQP